MKKIFICLLATMSLLILTACGEKYTITENEVNNITLEKYEDPQGRFEVMIPSGWQVSASTLADMSFAIHIYKPEEESSPKYHVYMQIKQELMLSEAMKAFEQRNFSAYPIYAIIYDAPVLKDEKVSAMWENFNEIMSYMAVYETGYDTMYLPSINNFEVIDEYELDSALKDYAIDDKIVRATFTDVYDGSLQQGLFTGSIVSAPLGNGTYSAYNINYISAPNEEFINYESLLSNIYQSIKISDDWSSQIMENTTASYDNARAIGESLQATYDSCNRAWEERNNTYDIISEKQSDATLGYERVYDVDTNEVYRAYDGFTDDYDIKELLPITDDMYTLPITGYIEKK